MKVGYRGGLATAMIAAILCLLGAARDSHADVLPHADQPITVESGSLIAEFKQDEQSRCDAYLTVKAHGMYHCHWGLTVTEKSTNRKLAHISRLRLTNLWISPDERYVVGLSNVQAQSGPHLLIVGRDGEVKAARSLHCGWEYLPSCSWTASQWVLWFDDADPQIELIEDEDLVLAVRLATENLDWLGPEYANGKSIPDRFVVPLNCSLNAQEAAETGKQSCKSYGIEVLGDYTSNEYGEMLDDEWFMITRWTVRRLLDQKRVQEALARINECVRRLPGDCNCAGIRVAILRRLGRSSDADELMSESTGHCRRWVFDHYIKEF